MSEYRRLTERSGNGIAIKDTSTNDNMSIWNAIERLAELEDKIENGTLVELPCKAGDKVYHLSSKTIREEIVITVKCEVTDGKISQFNSYILTDDKDDKYPNFYRLSKLGKSLFLTKPEAQAKLKQIRKEK